MSQIQVFIWEKDVAWGCVVDREVAERLLAALNADPENRQELELGLSQFQTSVDLGWRASSVDELARVEPSDDLMIIDLFGKTVVGSEDSNHVVSVDPSRIPDSIRHEYQDDPMELQYCLSSQWLTYEPCIAWYDVVQSRRNARSKQEVSDYRTYIYGTELLDFLISGLQKSYSELMDAEDDWDLEEQLLDIHEAWLLSPCRALDGQTPREVFMLEFDHVLRNMSLRRQWWQILASPPVAIPVGSHAYHNGSFGPHELAMYFELVQNLLYYGLQYLRNQPSPLSVDIDTFRLRLMKERDRFWHAQEEEFLGRSRASVAERERLRVPEVEQPESHKNDCDCPLCLMMEDLSHICFWQLDDSHLPDRYAFSWETIPWYDSSSTDEPFAEDASTGVSTGVSTGALSEGATGVTHRGLSGSAGCFLDDGQESEGLGAVRVIPSLELDRTKSMAAIPIPEDGPPELWLFSFECWLGHLIEGLKEANEPRETVELVLRHWAGLRDVIMSDREGSLGTLLAPSIERFRDLLCDIERTHPDLEPLCAALQAGLESGPRSKE